MSERVSAATNQTVTPAPTTGLLQRACACGQHMTAGGECEECRKKREGVLQRVAVSSGPTHDVPPIVHEVLRSPGQPLDAQTRAFMEPRFGHDFSGVRVHTDARAAESARAVDALAYTVGQNVVFGAGQYMPRTSDGQRLMAHELTHVMQQRDIAETSEALTIGHADDIYEQEMDRTSHRILLQPATTSRSMSTIRRALTPTLMRQQLFASTIETCRRDGIRSRDFQVSEGNLVVTANAVFEGASRHGCTEADYHMTLNQPGIIYDSEYGTCDFRQGQPFSRQWAHLPAEDYYLRIWTGNTNPNCCLRGDIVVEQRSSAEGASCTQPPPGPLEILHTALQVAGLIPALGAIPDAIDAGIYVIQGDWTGAGLSAAAMIPIFGEAATIGRIGARTVVRVQGSAVRRVGREGIETGLRRARAAEHAVAPAVSGARGFVRRITEAGLNHSFDRHAAEWFGEAVTRERHYAVWRSMIERVAASRQTFSWDLVGRPTVAHLGRVPLPHTQGPGRYLVVQFFADTGELATAFRPNPDQLAQMFRLLSQAP